MAARSQPKEPSCCSILCGCVNSIICWVFTLALSIAVAVVLYVLLTGDQETLDTLMNDPASVLVPSDMPGRNDTLLWREPSGQGGLQLEVLNALDDTWTPFFEEYIQKWDAGFQNETHTVDPLSLTVQRVEVDSQCEPVDGKLKACNGDYGKTDWRGINIALADQNNYIQNSISKYNDYWMTVGDMQNDDNQMKYTMCHELGHGWGLAHTDE
ncbi:hypothetical protein FisN_24Lh043 [Fistulifera solaris]|uniref:Peptidase M10 metallopeptidase domain-containing protein n=1 Tax=Fistulifera solaris TaxID=1519565 RepID=A0A1Z5KTW1_FISSO|nr:hypothetical protein FisN_24Lh043 [Fistulifera solaris]|eukprot:GAX29585.1 hypothetical protein FisN_24Lh043 [Fistulifera solaris]